MEIKGLDFSKSFINKEDKSLTQAVNIMVSKDFKSYINEYGFKELNIINKDSTFNNIAITAYSKYESEFEVICEKILELEDESLTTKYITDWVNSFKLDVQTDYNRFLENIIKISELIDKYSNEDYYSNIKNVVNQNYDIYTYGYFKYHIEEELIPTFYILYNLQDVTHTSIIGDIKFKDGIVLFTKTNSTQDVLNRTSYFDVISLLKFKKENDTEYVELEASVYGDFNFDDSIDRVITGEYVVKNDESIILFFESTNIEDNYSRMLNFSKINGYIEHTDVLSMYPIFEYDTLTLNTVSGGSLKSGSYQVSIRYYFDNQGYTDYSILTPSITIAEETNDGSKINTETSFGLSISIGSIRNSVIKPSYYQFAITYSTDTGTTVYQSEELYNYVSNSRYVIKNINSLSSITIEDVLLKNIVYEKASAHTMFENRLIIGDLKTDFGIKPSIGNCTQQTLNSIFEFISIDSEFELDLTSIAKSKVDYLNINFLRKGEYYKFYIGYIDIYGRLSHIIEIRDITGSTYNNTNGYHILDVNTNQLKVTSFNPGTDNIASYVLFQEARTYDNSNIIADGIIFRGMYQNVIDNTYEFQYNGDNLRFYSYDLILDDYSNLKNCSIYSHKTYLDSKEITRTASGSQRGVSFKASVDDTIFYNFPTPAYVIESEIKYIDNSQNENIASPTNINIIPNRFDINNSVIWNGTEYVYTSDLQIPVCMASLESSNVSFSETPNYSIISPILPFTSNVEQIVNLKGDHYTYSFTYRDTQPLSDFVPDGSSNDSMDNVYTTAVQIKRCISKYNLMKTFAINTGYKPFKTENSYNTDEFKAFVDGDYKIDNPIKTELGNSYNKIYNSLGNETIYNIDVKNLKVHFPNRILRSDTNVEELFSFGLNKFQTNNYKDVSIDKGSIKALSSNNKFIYLQYEFGLDYLQLKDTLSNDSNNMTYLGESDIFNNSPMMLNYANIQYIGCVSKLDVLNCIFGYFVLDRFSNKIYHISDNSVVEISSHFKEDIIKTNLAITSVKNGICYDFDSGLVYVYFQRMSDTSKYLSYNVGIKKWVSEHNFEPNCYHNISEFIHISDNLSIVERDKTIKGKFLKSIINVNGIKTYELQNYNSRIDIILNSNPTINKLFKNVRWIDEVRYNNVINRDVTISNIMIYNDDQCTNYMQIDMLSKDYISKYGVNKIGIKTFNELFNNSFKVPFMTDYGDIIESSFKAKNWYDKEIIISPYIIVSMIIDNEDNKDWNLTEITSEFIKDNRNE